MVTYNLSNLILQVGVVLKLYDTSATRNVLKDFNTNSRNEHQRLERICLRFHFSCPVFRQ